MQRAWSALESAPHVVTHQWRAQRSRRRVAKECDTALSELDLPFRRGPRLHLVSSGVAFPLAFHWFSWVFNGFLMVFNGFHMFSS